MLTLLQKLFVTGEDSPQLVHLVANLMKAELHTTVLAADDKTIKTKSVTGRFPVLETSEGSRVCDSVAIAKYLSRDHATFYGSTPQQRKCIESLTLNTDAEVDMWLDYVNSTVAPAAQRVVN